MNVVMRTTMKKALFSLFSADPAKKQQKNDCKALAKKRCEKKSENHDDKLIARPVQT